MADNASAHALVVPARDGFAQCSCGEWKTTTPTADSESEDSIYQRLRAKYMSHADRVLRQRPGHVVIAPGLNVYANRGETKTVAEGGRGAPALEVPE